MESMPSTLNRLAPELLLGTLTGCGLTGHRELVVVI